jgi:hypothetical protein
VEHSVPPTELVRPWRTATLVATSIAGLELVLLVVAAMVLLGRSLAPQVHAAAVHRALTPKPVVVKRAPAPAPAHRRHVVVELPRAHTGVVVLNGNGVQGAAAGLASLVKARGYVVKEVGNAPQPAAHTMVMFRPGFRREAARFGRDLNIGSVGPLDGMKPGQLHGAQVVVLLGVAR